MKSLTSLLLSMLAIAALLGCGGGNPGETPSPSEQARIVIDPQDVAAEIDPNIYGHFIENLGMCIYGGIWQDRPKTPTIHRGIRLDVVEQMKPIRPSVIRWPGGCFSDGYHWTDGIGPVRPVRINRAWWPLDILDPRIAPLDPNTFGTDEFMAFVSEVKASPYINVNFGTGTSEEAAAWVAYCNARTPDATPIGVDSNGVDWRTAGYWAQRREENGHREPYGVTYWGVGNEIYNWWEQGNTDSVSYAHGFIEFHDKMKAIDQEIKLVAVGGDEAWNKTVLEIAGDSIDYLSLHEYYPGVFETLGRDITDSEEDYYSILSSPIVLERHIESVRGTLNDVKGSSSRVRIALDEWNLWWDYRQLIHTDYSLRDGLFAAMVLIVLHRESCIVGMANLAQMVNTIGMINTSETDVFDTPLYYAFKLYRDHAQTRVVKSRVDADTYENIPLGNIPGIQGVPYLECSATMDNDQGRLTLFVVNRHYDSPITTRIQIENLNRAWALESWELNSSSPNARNDFQNKDRVAIEEKQTSTVSSSFLYSFPPHSATSLVLSPLQ